MELGIEQVHKDEERTGGDAEKRLHNYIAKAKLLGADQFEIDLKTSKLIMCNKKKWDTLVIPPVKCIRHNAFEEVKAKHIIIPDTVEFIEDCAFADATTNELTILGNTKIRYKLGFKKLSRLNIGKNQEYIDALYDAQTIETLNYINVETDNNYYKSINGIAYTKDMKQIITYPRAHKDKVYTMPNEVEDMFNQNRPLGM